MRVRTIKSKNKYENKKIIRKAEIKNEKNKSKAKNKSFTKSKLTEQPTGKQELTSKKTSYMQAPTCTHLFTTCTKKYWNEARRAESAVLLLLLRRLQLEKCWCEDLINEIGVWLKTQKPNEIHLINFARPHPRQRHAVDCAPQLSLTHTRTTVVTITSMHKYKYPLSQIASVPKYKYVCMCTTAITASTGIQPFCNE